MDISLILGAFAGMLLGFYGIAKAMLTQASKDREADRSERNQLSHAIQDMAGASGRVADATVRTAKEAKQRNGHLAELVAQGNETTAKILASGNKSAETLEVNKKILTTLKKSANRLSDEKKDGGLLVKTKGGGLLVKTNDDPLLVESKEDK